MKLTKRAADAAQPAAGRRVKLFDDEVSGFHLVAQPSGARAFYYYYRTASGQERRPKIGDYGSLTVDQARGIAKDWAQEVRAGGDPSRDRKRARRSETVADLAQIYTERWASVHKKARSAENDERLWRLHVLPKLGTKKVRDVTRGDIEGLHVQVGRDHPINANRLLSLLSKAFNLAEDWGLIKRRSSPVYRIQRFKERKRRRRLSPDEISRLGQALRTFAASPLSIRRRFAGLVLLLIFTGARLREIMHARWDWVDYSRGVLRLPDSKTNEEKEIALPPPAMVVLQQLERDRPKDNPWLIAGHRIGRPLIAPDRPWAALLAAAGITGLWRHDMRRAFAGAALSNEVTLDQVGGLLGHIRAETTQGYAWLYDVPKHRAAATAAAQIEAWMGEGRGADIVPLPKKRLDR